MLLTFQQLSACAKGAVIKTENPDGSIFLRRMTDAQKDIYPATDAHRLTGAKAAGITLDFYTDAKELTLTVSGICSGSRRTNMVDLLLDGKFSQSHCQQIPRGDMDKKAPKAYGPHTFPFLLPEGEKRVTLQLHYHLSADSLTLWLPDGATFRPYPHSRRVMIFGDSITQGCSVTHPSNAYAAILGRKLNAEVINHGISGERFRADKIVDTYPDCDLVTVAYGTNDFGHEDCSKEEFYENMPVFMEKLAKTFPKVPIFILLPLWRADEPTDVYNSLGTLDNVRHAIAQEAAKYANMTVIDCRDFIPHDPKNFADLSLHPNDTGMKFYATALSEAIAETL